MIILSGFCLQKLDLNIDWKCQVNSVKKKISKGNYLLWRHGKKLGPSVAKASLDVIYYTVLMPGEE